MSDALLQMAHEKAERRAKCKSDKLYLAERLGYDFQWQTHAELFANFIKYDAQKQWVDLSTIKDVMILWSRGHYKTTSIIVEIIQAILNFPNIRILIMQGSIPVTKTLLKQIVAHFMGEAEGSHLLEDFPEFCGTKAQLKSNVMQFTTTARTAKQLPQATVTVASPKSIKTGQHYDMGFFDDLVNESNYRKPAQLEKVKEDFIACQPLIDPGCYRFVTGTRWAFGDLYEEILRWQAASGKWLVSVATCWTTATEKLPDELKLPRFPRFTKKNGQAGGFTAEELLQKQTDDPANFACQYLNRPIHSSQQAYTEEMLHQACIPYNDTPPLSAAVLIIDLACSDAVKADDSVIQVGKADMMGVGYLCDQRGGQWMPQEVAQNVVYMALYHRPVKVLLEKSAAGMIFESFLRMFARQRNIYLPIEYIKVNNQADAKNMRVLSLAGAVKRGRFKFIMGLPKFDRLIEQGIQFPKGRYGHDDYIDTAALLYQSLSEDALSLPVRSIPRDPITAFIHDRENALVKVLTQQELQELDQQDMTGLE